MTNEEAKIDFDVKKISVEGATPEQKKEFDNGVFLTVVGDKVIGTARTNLEDLMHITYHLLKIIKRESRSALLEVVKEALIS